MPSTTSKTGSMARSSLSSRSPPSPCTSPSTPNGESRIESAPIDEMAIPSMLPRFPAPREPVAETRARASLRTPSLTRTPPTPRFYPPPAQAILPDRGQLAVHLLRPPRGPDPRPSQGHQRTSLAPRPHADDRRHAILALLQGRHHRVLRHRRQPLRQAHQVRAGCHRGATAAAGHGGQSPGGIGAPRAVALQDQARRVHRRRHVHRGRRRQGARARRPHRRPGGCIKRRTHRRRSAGPKAARQRLRGFPRLRDARVRARRRNRARLRTRGRHLRPRVHFRALLRRSRRGTRVHRLGRSRLVGRRRGEQRDARAVETRRRGYGGCRLRPDVQDRRRMLQLQLRGVPPRAARFAREPQEAERLRGSPGGGRGGFRLRV